MGGEFSSQDYSLFRSSFHKQIFLTCLHLLYTHPYYHLFPCSFAFVTVFHHSITMVLKVGSWTSHININISISISWESVGSGNFLALLQISRVTIFGREVRKRIDLWLGLGKPSEESQGTLQSEPLPSWHHSLKVQ